MFDWIAGWHPGTVIGLVAVIGFFLWMMVLSVTDAWKKVRLAKLEADQKREYLQRGLSIEDIERLLRSNRKPAKVEQPSTEQELEASLASLLVQYEVSGETMEAVLRVYQGTDPAAKKVVYDAINEMLESDADEEQLLSAVRSLCRRRDAAVSAGA